jgi:hypothetical protein
MTRRTRLALAAAGLVAFTATLGAALPATAEPGEDPVAADTADCPQWKWQMLEGFMRDLLRVNGRAGYELAFFDADTAAGPTTDFQCLTRWELTYADPRNPGAKSVQINYDLRTGATKLTDVSPRTPLPQTGVTPERAIVRAKAHGYTDPFYRLWLTAGEKTGEPEYTVSTAGANTSDYIVVDALTAKVSNYYFPDLPDPVIALQAGRYSGGTQTLQAYTCPARHPYLWNHDNGLGLNGTNLRGYRTGAGIHTPDLDAVDGLVSGWQQKAGGITTDDPGKDDNYLYALCTDDPALGYAAPAGTE